MGEVIKIYPEGSAKNPDAVLEQAIGKYDQAFIIGYDKDGRMDVRASTNMSCRDILWLLESFKSKMLNGDYFEGEEEEL